jgi:C2 domain
MAIAVMYFVLKQVLKPTAATLSAPLKVSVKIISAYMLPKPRDETKGEIIDPYVTVELSTPSQTEKFKTKHVNGFKS